MKTIRLRCNRDGTVNTYNQVLNLSNENEAVSITIDYSASELTGYTKRADIYVSQDQTVDYAEGTTANTFTFELTNEHTKQGYVKIQPIAYLATQGVEYVNSVRVKWEAVKINIDYSINATESTVVVSQTLGDYLQDQIDDLEEGKSDSDHNHDSDYAPLVHTHDDLYYTEDEIDAMMTNLTTPRWDDIVFELTPTKQGANLKPDFDFTNVGLLFPQNNVNEIMYITAQMPHAWLVGSTIFPHIHVVQEQNLQATFRIEYKWYNIGEEVPVNWSIYDLNQYATLYTSGSMAQIVKGASGIDGTNKAISSILKMRIFRTDNAYIGDILADQFDIHIQKDSFGSELEYQKGGD